MVQFVKKTVASVFMIGLLVLTILSVIGLVYLSQMAFTNNAQSDGKYCGNTTKTERNIARLAVVSLWIQFAWIILGSFLQPIWENDV